jgi:hypothetical protein
MGSQIGTTLKKREVLLRDGDNYHSKQKTLCV